MAYNSKHTSANIEQILDSVHPDGTLDLTALSGSNFYPVITEAQTLSTANAKAWEMAIISSTISGSNRNEANILRFNALACNRNDWSPWCPVSFVLNEYRDNASMRNFGVVGYSINSTGPTGLRYVLWLRGGRIYRYSSNLTLTLLTTSSNPDGNITYYVGANKWGGTKDSRLYILFDCTEATKTNVTSGVYNVTDGSTTYAEISAAVDAGKLPVLTYGSYRHVLVSDRDFNNGSAWQFSAMYYDPAAGSFCLSTRCINSSNTWTYKSKYISV